MASKRNPLEIAKSTARAFYVSEIEADPTGYPFSPADATKAAAKKSGLPASRLVPVVAAVYYEENGKRAPLSFSRGKATPAAVRSAVRKRRDAGGRLGRWEVVAVSLGVAIGRPVSVATVRALYSDAGGNLDESYTGRGTRAGAPTTRESETAEVDTTI
jgi:hypothetical protein